VITPETPLNPGDAIPRLGSRVLTQERYRSSSLDASLGCMRDTHDEAEAAYPMSTVFLQLAIPIRDTLFVGPRRFSQTVGGALRRDLELGRIENGVGFWVGHSPS